MEQTRLDLINRCLLAIGEAPLEDTTIVDTLPLGTDADVANRMIESTMREVLAIGWYFNMDYNFKLEPDSDGFISLPENVLRVDFGNTEFRHQYIVRNNKIYDVFNHKYVIDDILEADVVYYVVEDQLPVPAYEYIANRAARKFQQKVIGDVEMSKITLADELDALAQLQRIQLQTQDYNLRRGSRIHNGYLQEGLYASRGRR
jgi:hypothetical protein